MPDIAMCRSEDCPVREKCYRYRAKPGTRQTYFLEPPLKKDGRCSYFWKLEGENNA